MTKVDGKDVSVPSQGERFRLIRMHNLCRFCGHKGHSHKIHGDMTECPINGNSEHYNPDEPWEFGYLVATGKRTAK